LACEIFVEVAVVLFGCGYKRFFVCVCVCVCVCVFFQAASEFILHNTGLVAGNQRVPSSLCRCVYQLVCVSVMVSTHMCVWCVFVCVCVVVCVCMCVLVCCDWN